MSIQTKERANSRLRYAIHAIQGKEFIARDEILLQYCIYVKRDLEASGFWWQAKILDSWIHRFQGGEFTARRADLANRGEDSP